MFTKKSLITIVESQKYLHPDITLEEAIDIFTETVENYKNAKRREKLKWVAQAFIDACLVMSVDYLTGVQCGEIANNLATDLDTDKEKVERKINKLIERIGK